MGEYALYKGEPVKIGTCENMYYLRADQAHLVKRCPHSLDPIHAAEHIRFRFPFPDEDRIEPGAFRDPFRVLIVDGLTAPTDVEHESAECKTKPGHMGIAQQRALQGRLMLVMECACGSKWRLETIEDAMPVIQACRRMALAHGATGKAFYMAVADRIETGYKTPLPWLQLQAA